MKKYQLAFNFNGTEMKNNTYDLPNVCDNKKSFYGKAMVRENNDGSKDLLSYGYNTCTIDKKGNVNIHTDVDKWDNSTSMRHLKSFLLFNGKEIGSGKKSEIMKMYC